MNTEKAVKLTVIQTSRSNKIYDAFLVFYNTGFPGAKYNEI